MKVFVVMEHPVDMDGIYPDAYIDYWGEVYLANPQVRAAGVLFGTFLRYPAEILHAVAMQPIAIERVGLLARQRVVQRRMDLAARGEQLELSMDAAIVELEHKGGHCENGRWVEPLRHHAYPRHAVRKHLTEEIAR